MNSNEASVSRPIASRVLFLSHSYLSSALLRRGPPCKLVKGCLANVPFAVGRIDEISQDLIVNQI